MKFSRQQYRARTWAAGGLKQWKSNYRKLGTPLKRLKATKRLK